MCEMRPLQIIIISGNEIEVRNKAFSGHRENKNTINRASWSSMGQGVLYVQILRLILVFQISQTAIDPLTVGYTRTRQSLNDVFMPQTNL